MLEFCVSFIAFGIIVFPLSLNLICVTSLLLFSVKYIVGVYQSLV